MQTSACISVVMMMMLTLQTTAKYADDDSSFRALESWNEGDITVSRTKSQVSEPRLLPQITRIYSIDPKRNLQKRSGGTRSSEMPRVVKRLMGVELPDYLHGNRVLKLLRQRLLLAG